MTLARLCRSSQSKNLKDISKNMELIISNTNKNNKDWEAKKSVHMGRYGYLNIATNYPEI